MVKLKKRQRSDNDLAQKNTRDAKAQLGFSQLGFLKLGLPS